MYRVGHIDDPVGEEFKTATQAIRGMARAIHAQPLTKGERRAFDLWYTQRNYRSVAQRLRSGSRYEFAVQVQGVRQKYVIDPPQRRACEAPAQVPVTRGSAAAP